MNKELAEQLTRANEKFSNKVISEGPNVFTTGEYMKQMGLSRSGAQGRLSRLREANIIRPVKVRYLDSSGRHTFTDGWEYVEPNVKQ